MYLKFRWQATQHNGRLIQLAPVELGQGADVKYPEDIYLAYMGHHYHPIVIPV